MPHQFFLECFHVHQRKRKRTCCLNKRENTCTLRYYITDKTLLIEAKLRRAPADCLGLLQKAALWLCGLMALGFFIASSYNTTSLQSSRLHWVHASS